jgi:NAD(P)-dependent dehydrogenase (short-subunit alcohol dehydrogenase family)
VTAEVAVALARACQPTIVLLGRTPLGEGEPEWLAGLATEAEIKRAVTRHENGSASLREVGERARQVLARREIRHTLSRLEGVGVRAHYRAVDVRDQHAVAAALRAIQDELGPVRGLIHGAGVLADALIEDKTPEQFRRVCATKVDGLRALLGGVDQDELRLLVLFSSTTARLGRRGQVDYAVANEVLNKLAQRHARRHPACKVVSINWGPWAGGMVTPSLAQLFEQEGVGLIPLEEGAHWLVQEIGQSQGPVEVTALGASPPPLLPSSPPPLLPVALERRLGVQNCPVLRSHVFDGRPVLPVALMLEWFGQAALQQNPGLTFHGVNDLRVLRGVTFEEGSVQLRIRAGKGEKGTRTYRVPVEMHTAAHHGETLHARAEVHLVDVIPPPPTPPERPDLPEYGQGMEGVYETLFHGPQLQGIERVLGCGPEGIDGMITTAPPPVTWFTDPWRGRWLTDPLVLDGSFQLVILWTHQEKGVLSLPCKIGTYRQYRRAFRGSAVRAVVRVRRATAMQAVCDVDYLDEEGQLIARLEGHESTLDPALARVFERNDLSTASVTT